MCLKNSQESKRRMGCITRSQAIDPSPMHKWCNAVLTSFCVYANLKLNSCTNIFKIQKKLGLFW